MTLNQLLIFLTCTSLFPTTGVGCSYVRRIISLCQQHVTDKNEKIEVYEVHLNMNALYCYFYVIKITLWLLIGAERKQVNQSKLYIAQVIASKVCAVLYMFCTDTILNNITNYIVFNNYSTFL